MHRLLLRAYVPVCDQKDLIVELTSQNLSLER